MSNEAAKNAKISALILAKVAEGMSASQAVNAVLGAGTFEKLAGELYEALRASK